MPENETYIEIYQNRYILHENGVTQTFHQGKQTAKTVKRFRAIKQAFEDGFLDTVYSKIKPEQYADLSQTNKELLSNLVSGLTSEVGRGLVGICCLQLAIKCIAPEQCIRLHKGSPSTAKFSWSEGISMRTLDSRYNVPFLRKHNLLKLNKDGCFMTRSLAENYPYTHLYKAEIRGPLSQWLSVVDAIETDTLPPSAGLYYLLHLLKQRSDDFQTLSAEVCSLLPNYKHTSWDDTVSIIEQFFNETQYSARAFEVVIHCFYQTMYDSDLADETTKLVPLSQMRSANKKHHNVGDIEIQNEDGEIVKSLDAKYGKPYLRDELEELWDKLEHYPHPISEADFICNTPPDRRNEITARIHEISNITHTDIHLYSFKEWLQSETDQWDDTPKQQFGYSWLTAIVESFALKRLSMAPIDEPCEGWLQDLKRLLTPGTH